MASYRHPDAQLTLREGLAQFYQEHPELKRQGLSPEAQAFFHRHDTVHVVYGCDTSLAQEAVVKLASIFGTTGGLSVLRGYRLYESLDIYRQLAFREILWTLLRAWLLVPMTIYRSKRQAEPWPWADFDSHLDTPLADLRRRYGIAVARA